PPYAWLQVTVRNESGAYAFFTDENSSDFPPVLLEQGQDSTLAVKLKRGNDITNYSFTVRTNAANNQFPDQAYWENVKAFANGSPIDVTVGVGAFLNFYLPGHDTTHVLIIY
ncbi:MAG: hypothetical protein ABIO24_08355, partial [Saprospiraceae bacterium]